MIKFILACVGTTFALNAFAEGTNTDNAEKLVHKYTNIAHSVSASFKEPSVMDGKIFFNRKFKTDNGKEASCSSCHTTNPANTGKNIVTGKSIPPLSPGVNPKRFTNLDKVEEEFTKHCNDILGADCSAAEKANFIAYLLTETKPGK